MWHPGWLMSFTTAKIDKTIYKTKEYLTCDNTNKHGRFKPHTLNSYTLDLELVPFHFSGT